MTASMDLFARRLFERLRLLALVEKFLQLVKRLFTSKVKIAFGGLVMLLPPFHGLLNTDK